MLDLQDYRSEVTLQFYKIPHTYYLHYEYFKSPGQSPDANQKIIAYSKVEVLTIKYCRPVAVCNHTVFDHLWNT